MSLVRVPNTMKDFQKWVRDVTQSAQLRFGTRVKASSSSRTRTSKTKLTTSRWRKFRRRRRRKNRTRRIQNGLA